MAHPADMGIGSCPSVPLMPQGRGLEQFDESLTDMLWLLGGGWCCIELGAMAVVTARVRRFKADAVGRSGITSLDVGICEKYVEAPSKAMGVSPSATNPRPLTRSELRACDHACIYSLACRDPSTVAVVAGAGAGSVFCGAGVPSELVGLLPPNSCSGGGVVDESPLTISCSCWSCFFSFSTSFVRSLMLRPVRGRLGA